METYTLNSKMGGGMIPYSSSPLGGIMQGYARSGLVLWLDALTPRRDGTVPATATTLWEDLSGNGYDITLNSALTFTGTGPVYLNGIYGKNTSMPRSNDYVVELCLMGAPGVTPSVQNAPFFPLSATGYGLGLGGSNSSSNPNRNQIQRGDSENNGWHWAVKGLSRLWSSSLATIYFAKDIQNVFISGAPAESYAGVDLHPESNNKFGDVNGYSVFNDRGSNITLAAMRIYNRELSSAEAKHHWLLDKMRYRI